MLGALSSGVALLLPLDQSVSAPHSPRAATHETAADRRSRFSAGQGVRGR